MIFNVDQAASLLLEARIQGRQVRAGHPCPTDAAQAYAVQDAVAKRSGPVGGWKVGAKAPDQTPNAAPIFKDLIRPAPAVWPGGSLHMRGVEAEIAFKIAEDIAPRPTLLAEREIFSVIESVHAAIEIVDTRLSNWREADRMWVLADSQSNGGLVFDPVGVPWRNDDFCNVAVELVINGQAAAAGRGGNPAGDLRRLLVWIVNHCALFRGGLTAGTIITTGSYTGMIFVDPGATVEARFSGLGAVSLHFS